MQTDVDTTAIHATPANAEQIFNLQDDNIFQLRPQWKTAVFVDGPNIGYCSRTLGQKLRYDILLDIVSRHSELISANFFNSTFRDQDSYAVTQRFHDYLAFSGWTVYPREGYTNGSGQYQTLDIDMTLAAIMVEQVMAGAIDTVILVGNDGDYVPIMKLCVRKFSTRFLHLSWSVVDETHSIRPSRMLRQEAQLSLDISLPELTHLLLEPK